MSELTGKIRNVVRAGGLVGALLLAGCSTGGEVSAPSRDHVTTTATPDTRGTTTRPPAETTTTSPAQKPEAVIPEAQRQRITKYFEDAVAGKVDVEVFTGIHVLIPGANESEVIINNNPLLIPQDAAEQDSDFDIIGCVDKDGKVSVYNIHGTYGAVIEDGGGIIDGPVDTNDGSYTVKDRLSDSTIEHTCSVVVDTYDDAAKSVTDGLKAGSTHHTA